MALCPAAVAKGNANVVSDAGVAVLMAEAALRGAALNVLINLKWIKDDAFVAEQRARLDKLLADSTPLRDEIYASVVDAL
jgi:formiminotetrahydrofolate cyclodeaminase